MMIIIILKSVQIWVMPLWRPRGTVLHSQIDKRVKEQYAGELGKKKIQLWGPLQASYVRGKTWNCTKSAELAQTTPNPAIGGADGSDGQ